MTWFYVNTILWQLAVFLLAAVKGVTRFIANGEPDPELASKQHNENSPQSDWIPE